MADRPLEPATKPLLPGSTAWAGVVVLALGVLFAWTVLHPRKRTEPLPRLFEVPAFALVDQHGRGFSSESLRGHVWVANFIFTRCPTVCPLFTERMRQLELGTHALAPRLQLVSFSVDPEYDTPARLLDYAKAHRAQQGHWHFLTGAQEDVRRVVVDGLKEGMDRVEEGADLRGVAHGSHFVLVDPAMRVRGYYAFDAADTLDRLSRDIQAVLEETP